MRANYSCDGQSGDEAALGELIAVVYNELRRAFRSALRRQSSQFVLQPTALVDEDSLRLVGGQQIKIRSRRQFYGLAAKIMRKILVNQMRRRRAAKRRGSRVEISLKEVIPAEAEHVMDFLILYEP